MPWFVSDRILWTAVLLGAVVTYYYVPSHLEHVANITITPQAPDNAPNKQLRTDAEQALSHDTLKILSDGYSHDIRAAVTKIAANRSINSRTKRLLLVDLASKDGTKRWSAICALNLLLYHQLLSDRNYLSQFRDYRSLKAMIAALENLLDEHISATAVASKDHSRPSSPVRPLTRPAHEDPILLMLRDVLTTSSLEPGVYAGDVLNLSLKAGLVSKWLAKYPFPCALPENAIYGFTKSDVCRLMSGATGGGDELLWGKVDDPVMARIFQHIMSYPEGVQALRDVGLLPSEPSEDGIFQLNRDRGSYSIDDVRMVNGESTAGALTPPELRELLETARDERRDPRPTEIARRRHREAVVMAEAGVPLRRENILQRRDSNLMAEAPVIRDMRTPADSTNGAMYQEERLDRHDQSSEPIAVPEQPWDLQRQEIEGEAIVNESIREGTSNFRALRNSNSGAHASGTDGSTRTW